MSKSNHRRTLHFRVKLTCLDGLTGADDAKVRFLDANTTSNLFTGGEPDDSQPPVVGTDKTQVVEPSTATENENVEDHVDESGTNVSTQPGWCRELE